MFWWIVAGLAVVLVLVVVRDLTRRPGSLEPGKGDPVRDDHYGHRAREEQGWNIPPPDGGHGS